MYLKTLLMIAIAVLLVVFIRSAGNGFIGNWITTLFCRIFHVGWEEAVWLYWRYVRQYMFYIIGFSVIVFFMLFFRILLSGFTRYFDEIIRGINMIANKDKKKIKMSKELSFVADKLSQVKDELEQRTKEKEEAEKRKDELIVYLAHDIKTPLTSVIGYLDLLVENEGMPKEQQSGYLRIARDKALRLETLINDFFEITRSHVQQMELHKTVVNLSYLMEQVIDEAYPLFQKAGKTVTTTIDTSVQVNVDAQKMARVFTNLLKNAINYSEGNGPISIVATTNEKGVHIAFSNAGEIGSEELSHIFEKFYRVDDARQTKTGGAGLGLAISKEIVQAHQGTITGDSKDGQITLTVSLPLNHVLVNP